MYDPYSLAFRIHLPFPRKRADWEKEVDAKDRAKGLKPQLRLVELATIWHKDPSRSAHDDSCGWYLRPRHDDPVLKRIVERFDWDFDSSYSCDGTTKYTGWFAADGEPRMSTIAIVNNMFVAASHEHFGYNRRKSKRFMRKYMSDIIHFSENPVDSMSDSIHQTYGKGATRAERISGMASTVYGCILNWERPWYRKPRWHIRHWTVSVPFFQHVHHWLFDRCEKCGKGFKWREGRAGMGFHSKKVMHMDCSGYTVAVTPKTPEAVNP